MSEDKPRQTVASVKPQRDGEWRPIATAPTDGTRFLAYQRGEVWHAYGAINPRLGVPYFVRRAHERRRSATYRMLPVEVDGRLGEHKVILWEGPDNYEFHWVSWSRDFDFQPTHWAPLPSPPRDQQVSPAIRDEQDISPAQASGFVLDTSGVVLTGNLCPHPTNGIGFEWSDLSPFAQGYVEGLFADLNRRRRRLTREGMRPYAFSDLAAETLDRIRADCEANTREFLQPRGFDEVSRSNGRHFWTLRQAGFWPTRWPPLTPTLGDDGRVYLREASQPTPTEA